MGKVLRRAIVDALARRSSLSAAASLHRSGRLANPQHGKSTGARVEYAVATERIATLHPTYDLVIEAIVEIPGK